MKFPAEHLPRCLLAHRWARLLAPIWIASMALSVGLASARPARAGGDAPRVHWTPVTGVLVKLDGKTPLAWNVYQTYAKSKKKESSVVLVLLGRRYLLLDFKATRVYAVPLAELHPQGSDLESGDLAQPSRLLPSSDWTARDVGPAELIQLTLGDYGRVLTVQLPHPPDLRHFY
jgi:hypothetical protein